MPPYLPNDRVTVCHPSWGKVSARVLRSVCVEAPSARGPGSFSVWVKVAGCGSEIQVPEGMLLRHSTLVREIVTGLDILHEQVVEWAKNGAQNGSYAAVLAREYVAAQFLCLLLEQQDRRAEVEALKEALELLEGEEGLGRLLEVTAFDRLTSFLTTT